MVEENNIIALTEAVYYILLSLDEPMHGYGIMQNIKMLSHGRVKLAAGTLYGALSTLVERDWIRPVGKGGERKKEYQITAIGRQVVLNEIGRLIELLENGSKIVKGWHQ